MPTVKLATALTPPKEVGINALDLCVQDFVAVAAFLLELFLLCGLYFSSHTRLVFLVNSGLYTQCLA
jgi:hypothetical protein